MILMIVLKEELMVSILQLIFEYLFQKKKMSRKVANKYVPPFENLNLFWYERDVLLTYIDQLKIQTS